MIASWPEPASGHLYRCLGFFCLYSLKMCIDLPVLDPSVLTMLLINKNGKFKIFLNCCRMISIASGCTHKVHFDSQHVLRPSTFFKRNSSLVKFSCLFIECDWNQKLAQPAAIELYTPWTHFNVRSLTFSPFLNIFFMPLFPFPASFFSSHVD